MTSNKVRPRRERLAATPPATLASATLASARVLALVTALVMALVGVGSATSPAADAAAAAPAPAAPPGCVTAGVVTTCTFGYTGTWQPWTVPPEVDKATFRVVGASGGDTANVYGGRGGGVVSTLNLTPGQQYRLYVGGRGGNSYDVAGKRGVGGFNGGGNGAGWLNPNGAGGGGASDVRYPPYTEDQRVLVGGGGGGAGAHIHAAVPQQGRPGSGGDGGGTGDGNQGTNVSGAMVGAGGGGGGTSTGPGFAGGASGGWIDNACGFWNPAVPVAGNGGVEDVGGPGGFNKAFWSGARCDQVEGWGGGGGGGWYGGGGGGGGTTGGAGGGGGSGHAPPASGSTIGKDGAAGQISITYIAPTERWSSLGGTITSAPTIATRPHTGKLLPVHDVFYLDQNSQVIQRVVTDGVPGPEHNLGAVLYPGSSVAAIWRPDGQRLDLFGRGTENALWHKTFTWAGGWGHWQAITAPGTLTSDPTAGSLHSTAHVFFRGEDDALHVMFSFEGSWHDKSMGGFLDSAPGGAVSDGELLRVFFYGIPESGGETTLVQKRLNYPQTWLSPALEDHQLVTSTVATSSPGPSKLGIIFRDQTSGLAASSLLEQGGVWSAWREFDAPPSPAGSAPALLATQSGNGIVYLRGLDNTLIARVLDLW